MSNILPPSQFLFNAILSNPYLHSLYQGLRTFLPEAVWFVTDPEHNRSPFPQNNSRPFCGEAGDGEVKQEHIRSRLDSSLSHPDHCYHVVTDCCEGYLQGVVQFYLRGELLGGLGICHVSKESRPLLEQVLKIIEGYLALLAGSLEDHDDLERVHGLWTETLSMVDLNELLERMVGELCETLMLKRGVILLINEDGEFYPAHARELPSKLLKQRNMEITRYDYMERIGDANEVLMELPEDDPLRRWLFAALEELGSSLHQEHPVCHAVTFYRRSYLIGVFLTLTEPGHAITEIKENVVRMLAVGGAAAIDNALTLERMNQRRKALSTIHVVHRLISSSISTNELLPKIGQLARQLLNARRCSLMLYDRVAERLIPKVALGLDKNEMGQKPLDLGEGLPGWVAENYNPVLYHPTGNSPAPWLDAGEVYPADSYLAVALFDNDIEGVITVADKPGDFTPGDREILVTFAEQAILALKNARMHEGERTITVNALRSIANLMETHDPTRPGITVTASDWARDIARQMNLSDREQLHITVAALLRDTGMLSRMQSGQNENQQRLKGPELSLKVVQSLGLPEDVGKMVYHANEAWNGEGFPQQLKGSDIPLGSRIIAVANAYTSLLIKWNRSGEDPDRKRQERAFKIISRLSHKTFDPDVVNALEQALHNPKVKEEEG